MSEHQKIIDQMMALAYADEGDRITSSDLAECETAACVIEDLEAQIAEANKFLDDLMFGVEFEGYQLGDVLAKVANARKALTGKEGE